MKKLNLILATLLVPLLLFSQTTPNDEIKSLNDKVNALAKKEKNLQWQLAKFKKSELILNDSLRIQINAINKSITSLYDSLSVMKQSITATDKKVVDLQGSVSTLTTIVYIALLILLVIGVVIYFLVISRIKAFRIKNDTQLAATKDNLFAEIGKIKRELENKIDGHSHQ